ncbi:MAG: DEAD/DEAH box helicase [Candidatus Rokubacteria bacterium]|nr:DEAD/DEAH box helicase [Candidatus Rokubacteria bacterium]MBI3827011.1 DEAD/DEAH box helicase [Candidatus Rokubacteria bacterium]
MAAILRDILDDLLTSPSTGPCVTCTRHFTPRPPVLHSFPASLDPRLAEALRARGIEQLYSHQAQAFETVATGTSVVVVTPTASGKTLCYNLPVLQALLEQPGARVLYLFPTKALAQDQLAELEQLARQLPELRMFTYDGDTPQDARRAVRARANLVLTNPDMLHSGILPHHTKWAALFQNLRYVVIDELHAYRGVFGSHVADVLRRLRRLCRHYGSSPRFIMASATIANPRELAERITGEPVEEVAESGAPTGDKLFVCYNPPVVNPELGIRAPYLGEAAKLALRFLRERIPTIVFAQSRLATEVLLTSIKTGVADRTGDAGMVRGYRGGYLPTRRRAVEQGLRAGEVLGVVSTNALELGVDIGHLDVAVLAGYPGTIASLWQQSGRAGRRSGPSAAFFVATSAPLDQFMVTHPDYLFGTAPEHARINPDNPFILVNHLKCAAFELPFGAEETFGEVDVRAHLAALEDEALLHRAGGRWHWASETYPADHISLRTVTTDNFLVIDTTSRDEKQTKRRNIIAEVDWGSAFATIHPKAIYLVESVPFEVQELHFREDEEKVAYVKRVNVDYFTDAVSAKGVWILRRLADRGHPAYVAEQGEVLVAEKVVGFKKIKMGTLENVGSGEVELPQQEMQTTSAWLTPTEETLAAISRSRDELIDGLRAVSYLLHHLAPIFLLCDVRDVGSWLGDTTPAETGAVATRESTRRRLLDAERFNPTIYLYDSHAGGIGLAERLFEILPQLLARGLETLEACPCRAGCPSCVGPVNEVGRRAKPIARALLRALTA